MRHVDQFVGQLASQLHDWNGTHSTCAFAAVLIVYIFIVFGRSNMSS